MREFNNLLACEFYKLNRKKTFLKIAIAIVVIVLVTMAIGLVVEHFLSGMVPSTTGSYEDQLEYLKYNLQTTQEAMQSSKLYKLLYFNQLYPIKAQIAMYEYLIQNDVPAGSVTTYFYGTALEILDYNYYNFTIATASIVMTIVTIYVVVMACRNTIGEYNSGAMKMQLIRPVNKQKFYTAKWLSVYIAGIAILFLSMCVAFLIGLLAFGGYSPDVLCILDAKNVIRMSPLTAMVVNFLINSFKLFAYLQMTMFINSIVKKSSTALLLNILLIIVEVGNIIEMVLAAPYVGFLGFFVNLNWESMMSVGTPTLRGMRLWVSIPVSIIWTTLFMVFAYRNFAKKEV